MSVRVTYWTDPFFTQPLECCESDLVPPANFFISSDKFGRSNSSNLGTDEQGHRWIIERGKWDIANLSLRTTDVPATPTPSGTYNIARVEGASAADVSAEAILRFTSPSFLGCVVRYQSLSRYYLGAMSDRGLCYILKMTDQYLTAGVVLVSTALSPLQTARLTFRATGDLLELLVDGEIVLTVRDSDIAESGFPGLFGYPTQAHVGQVLGSFDNWYAEGDG